MTKFRTYSFEKLEAWKVAKEFAIRIYRITEKFPEEEKYELTRQLRKGAVGIPSHLAEGSGRITGKDKAHFTSMAFSTLMEIINQIIISYEFILDAKWFGKFPTASVSIYRTRN